jgi:hypothetical protein
VSNPGFRFATVQGQNIHWFLKRNCSVTPAQLGWLYVSLCVVSLGIGAVFWFQGALLVLPFAGAELVSVGAAFLVYARHAGDGETISLQGRQLVVELENAGRLERAEFNRDWVRVEPLAGGPVADRAVGPGAACEHRALCAPGTAAGAGPGNSKGLARGARNLKRAALEGAARPVRAAL